MVGVARIMMTPLGLDRVVYIPLALLPLAKVLAG